MNSPAKRTRRTAVVAAPASSNAPSSATWYDLSEEERTALRRLNRGPYPALTQAMGQRLIDLGLAVSRADGVGISRTGRELVINTLLEARHEDKER
ncbi:MAG: hypothetical protein JNK47_18760 [Mesorhizobium sp.]|nr:hypothetical protein [Mesorhizobium sp.]MBL8579254.1 hypothetical protein [Mesorhizobium sp.]